MTEPPFYYRYFVGDGRELLAETLGDPNPFTMPGDKIVERVLAAGYTPNLKRVERDPYPRAGRPFSRGAGRAALPRVHRR